MVKAGPWRAADYPLVEQWLQSLRKPLDTIVAGSRRKRLMVPIFSRGESIGDAAQSAIVLCAILRASDALIARANRALAQGRVDEAWEDLSAIHRMGELFQSNTHTVLNQYIGIAMMRRANEHLVRLAASESIDPQTLGKLFERSSQWQMPAFNLAPTDLVERLYVLEAVLARRTNAAPLVPKFETIDMRPMIAKHYPLDRVEASFKPALLERVDWNRLLRERNAEFDRVVKRMRDGDRAAMAAAAAASIKEGVAALKYLKTVEPGKDPTHWMRCVLTAPMFGPDMFIPLERSRLLYDEAVAVQQLRRVALMLAMYKASHGRYPDALDELLDKKYAKNKNELRDPFSDETFRYRRTDKGYVLYSFGSDGDDDNATPKDGLDGDLVIEAPIARGRDFTL